MKKISITLSLLLLLACEKNEEPLPGIFITEQIGEADLFSENNIDYQKQLYFDLSTNSLKAENKRNIWDIALSADPSAPNLFVNSAMLQSVAATGVFDFNQTLNSADFDFNFERAASYYFKGFMQRDFSANQPAGQVFIINLGRDFANNKRGFKKLQIVAFNQGSYTLKVANLDNSQRQEVSLETTLTYNYQFISLSLPDRLLSLEPPKAEWDFHFTRYMERLLDGNDTLDYSVTGVLLNTYFTEAYLVDSTLSNSKSFGQLNLNDVQATSFLSRSNAIGHAWKNFSLNTAAFSVNTSLYYFVKDVNGKVYRLRFTGFYTSSGRKGAVRFEFLPV
jgi:hypothetical protein